MDIEENGTTEIVKAEPEIKEESSSENQLREDSFKTEDDAKQMSHREAMAVWKEGLAEMIEVSTFFLKSYISVASGYGFGWWGNA